MPEAIVDAVVPLERKEAVPIVSVKEEQEGSGLPLRDTLPQKSAAQSGREGAKPAPDDGEPKPGASQSQGEPDKEHEHGRDEDDDDDDNSVSDLSMYEELLNDTEPYKYVPGNPFLISNPV